MALNTYCCYCFNIHPRNEKCECAGSLKAEIKSLRAKLDERERQLFAIPPVAPYNYEELVEALEDIARGPLQEPVPFVVYAKNRAMNALANHAKRMEPTVEQLYAVSCARLDPPANTLPWHVGFHNQIADMLRPTGDFHPDMVRYSVVQICDHDGRHVCWAKSPEHAAMIVDAVNKFGG